MNRNLATIVRVSAVSLLVGGVFAQVAVSRPTSRAECQHPPKEHQQSNRSNGVTKASDVIGMKVLNYQGDPLGSVEDLAVDMQSGRIVQVILSTRAYLGLHETLSAVPPGALHLDGAGNVLRLNASEEKLSRAPRFQMSKWRECNQFTYVSSVYLHYEEEPAFRYMRRGENLPGNVPPGERVPGAKRLPGGPESMILESPLIDVQKASELMSMTARDPLGGKVGAVRDLLLDLEAGRIVSVTVSTGGFLGWGDELGAVPPTALRHSSIRGVLEFHAASATPNLAPLVGSEPWPGTSKPISGGAVSRVDRLQSQIRLRPSTRVARPPIGAADPNAQPLTPLHQGKRQVDLETIAQIRRGILSVAQMSSNARNVKMIINNGEVTLCGVVDSVEEKRLIGRIAYEAALVESVDNKLEVRQDAATSGMTRRPAIQHSLSP